ncbi:Hint domain-containing protein [Gymnodinialimonas sp.]
MVAFLDGLFFSEILADNAGSGAFDTDGDGATNKADEYIEIQNNTKSTIDLSNYSIWSAQRGELFDFGTVSNPSIASDGTATVVGNYTGTPPMGSNYFSAGLPEGNANQGFLEDGESGKWDTIYLVNETTLEYIALEYGPSHPGNVATPLGFPGTINVGLESTTSDAPNATSIQRDANGDLVEGTPDPDDSGPVCFVKGTQILTATGPRPIEDLAPGDLIVTRDNGPQTLRWIGSSAQSRAALCAAPHLRPIRIATGALGKGLPTRDLLVSPQHRILVQSRIAERMFGPGGVLVPAVKLLPLPGVTRMGPAPVTYYHLLFDRHEIVFSEGSATESLYLGPMARETLGADALAEIAALFPDLPPTMPTPARGIPKGHRLRRLVERHGRNPQRQLIEAE